MPGKVVVLNILNQVACLCIIVRCQFYALCTHRFLRWSRQTNECSIGHVTQSLIGSALILNILKPCLFLSNVKLYATHEINQTNYRYVPFLCLACGTYRFLCLSTLAITTVECQDDMWHSDSDTIVIL